ncbi:hypothetical protein COV93_02485 [Candidatus Woesearchaeota archaeon CG11_big_fil_rev_8_21_14_0_20_43_8]|nr:MAG: hypothetical protein COV93_02485 [Candidatus Woesearchaeota archaeon CG11_big_fil_rev_8_21_14_0_20_43_8]PIO09008.1 MAG: hypothetical protein COT47_00200 [Candidatus Woesearchaeota archaeon CG08_land_8_20_14_0_20_43_7]
MPDKEIIQELTDEFGRVMEFMGLPPVTGRMWAILYFKGEMTQEALKEELGCALSSVSQSITILENFNLIYVSGKDGRKKIYSTETDFNKIKRKKLEAMVRHVIEPLTGLCKSRVDDVKDPDVKTKIGNLHKVYSQAGLFIKLVLKLPFGK